MYNYEAPPALELPTSLVKSRFKVFLSRSAVDLPWGIYLDERFATLNVYICQELEEQPEAPVCLKGVCKKCELCLFRSLDLCEVPAGGLG